MHLKSLLLDYKGKNEGLVEGFMKYFQTSEAKATDAIVELLFHSAGWPSFIFDRRQFPDVARFRAAKFKGPIELHAAILDRDTDFMRLLYSFLVELFPAKRATLLYNEAFMEIVIKSIHMLGSENWDAFRLTAFIAALAVLEALKREQDTLEDEDQPVDPLGNPPALRGTRNATKSYNRLTAVAKQAGFCICKSVCRCNCCMLRSDHSNPTWRCSNLKLLQWSIDIKSVKYRNDFFPFVVKDLRDHNYNTCASRFIVLYQFLRRKSNVEVQLKLFEYVKVDLILALKLHTDNAETAIRTILAIIRYMDITLSEADVDAIMYYLYDDSQTLALLAGEFVYMSQLSHYISEPNDIIIRLVEINRESHLWCPELLIDALYDYITDCVSWINWYSVITNSPTDDLYDFMAMLVAYVRKSVGGHTPRFRVTKMCVELTPNRLNQNQAEYSEFFLQYWLLLLESEKFKENKKAVAKLLHLVQYFNATVPFEKLRDMAYVCLAFFVEDQDNDVITEATAGLSSIRNILFSSPEVKNALSVAWDISLSQFRSYRTDPQICTTIRVLLQLLMSQLNEVMALPQDGMAEQRDLINKVISRTVALRSLLKLFVDPLYRIDVRRAAFTGILDILEFFGPHQPAQVHIWPIKPALDEEEVTCIVSFATELVECSSQCRISQIRAIFTDDGALNDCCGVVYKVIDFIARGFLDVHCFTPFIKLMAKDGNHDEIIINGLNAYSMNFPRRWLELSNSLYNALIGLIEDTLPMSSFVEDSPIFRARYTRLYSDLLNTTQILSSCHFSTTFVLRRASFRLHVRLVDEALRPGGLLPLLHLLYPLRDILSPLDGPLVVSVLEQYKVDSCAEVVKYYNFVKQSFMNKVSRLGF